MNNGYFFLAELSDRDVDWIVEVGIRETLAPGQVLIYEGRPLYALYIVLSGQLAVYVARSHAHPIAYVGRGELLGEMSFVGIYPPAATVSALTESQVLAIPRSQLAGRLHENEAFAVRFYRAIARFLSSRVRQTFAQLYQQRLVFQPTGSSTQPQVDRDARGDRILARLKGDRGNLQ